MCTAQSGSALAPQRAAFAMHERCGKRPIDHRTRIHSVARSVRGHPCSSASRSRNSQNHGRDGLIPKTGIQSHPGAGFETGRYENQDRISFGATLR
jgi:hypothetical protein